MDTKIALDIAAAEQEAKYDAQVKLLLSEKSILARIMQGCLKEYADCTPEEISNCIEGNPAISEIALHPNGEVIRGLKTEDKSLFEGNIYYDIRFTALVPHTKTPIELIINIEAQNNFYPGYPLIKRAIYYCSRMISAQYGTEFTGEEYGKLKKVYSIWICTDPPKRLNNTIFRYSMQQEVVEGATDFAYKESDFDLISVIFVCLGKSDAKNKVLGLLNLLLIEDASAITKCRRLEADFGIAMTNDFSKEVDYMCNLSSGVLKRGYERGMAQGMAQGKAHWLAQGVEQGISQGVSQGITISLRNLMKNKNFTLEDSMSALGIPPSEKEKYAALLNCR